MHSGRAVDLSVSIVTYAPNTDILRQAVRSLQRSVVKAGSGGIVSRVRLLLVDHGPGSGWYDQLTAIVEAEWESDCKILSPKKNRGFGAGHNMAVASTDGLYHLVMNPDVVVYDDAISEAIRYLEEHQKVGLVTPRGFYPTGNRQYLCKRYPSVLDLFLRGFAPRFVRKRCTTRLDDYQMRGITEDRVVSGVTIASGCFMFLRRSAFNGVGGFARRFFLYFEDFDVCIRLRQAGWDIAYVPDVGIIHYGGSTANKGLRHVTMFVSSAAKFFNQHGWKLS